MINTLQKKAELLDQTIRPIYKISDELHQKWTNYCEDYNRRMQSIEQKIADYSALLSALASVSAQAFDLERKLLHKTNAYTSEINSKKSEIENKIFRLKQRRDVLKAHAPKNIDYELQEAAKILHALTKRADVTVLETEKAVQIAKEKLENLPAPPPAPSAKTELSAEGASSEPSAERIAWEQKKAEIEQLLSRHSAFCDYWMQRIQYEFGQTASRPTTPEGLPLAVKHKRWEDVVVRAENKVAKRTREKQKKQKARKARLAERKEEIRRIRESRESLDLESVCPRSWAPIMLVIHCGIFLLSLWLIDCFGMGGRDPIDTGMYGFLCIFGSLAFGVYFGIGGCIKILTTNDVTVGGAILTVPLVLAFPVTAILLTVLGNTVSVTVYFIVTYILFTIIPLVLCSCIGDILDEIDATSIRIGVILLLIWFLPSMLLSNLGMFELYEHVSYVLFAVVTQIGFLLSLIPLARAIDELPIPVCFLVGLLPLAMMFLAVAGTMEFEMGMLLFLLGDVGAFVLTVCVASN